MRVVPAHFANAATKEVGGRGTSVCSKKMCGRVLVVCDLCAPLFCAFCVFLFAGCVCVSMCC